MNLYNYIQQGGPVMYVLLAFSILTAAIVMYKLFHFYRLDIWKNNLIIDALDSIKAGHIKNALEILAKTERPCAYVTKKTVELCLDKNYTSSEVASEVRRYGTIKLREMESYLRGLAVIAHLSPLVGLLGTVFGMITAFITLESTAGQASPALLAGGIWEALLTTAFGLAIAIPALAAYYFLEGEVDKAKARMKDAVSQVLLVFNQVGEERNSELSTSDLSKESYGF